MIMGFKILAVMFWGAASLAPAAIAGQQPEPVKQQTVQPAATVNKYNFFGKQAYIVEPKIEAVLLLSDEQKKKLAALQTELLTPISAQESRRKSEERKAGKNPTREERRANALSFALQLTQALRDIQKRAKDVLTPEQLTLISTIDAALKVDPAVKIETLLNPEQLKALRTAKA